MTIRIWLSTKGEAQIQQPVQGRADQFKVDERTFSVSTENGHKYISLNIDPNASLGVLPTIPREFILKITYRDQIYTGFRTAGVYRHKGAMAYVDLQMRVHGHQLGDSTIEKWQTISISAKSIKTLFEIYSLVRTGKLKPDENWEADALTQTADQA